MPRANSSIADFDREVGLAQAIAAEGAARHGVGVDGVAVDLLVRAAVDADQFAAGVVEHAGAVIAVRAGIGDDVHGDRGEGAVAPHAGFDADLHRMAGSRADELLLAGELELHRPSGPQGRQRDDVLDQHLLLAAEAAADAVAVDPHGGRREVEQGAQRAAGEERGLRARAHVEVAVAVEPGHRAVGFEMGVLDALSDVGRFVNEVGGGEALLDVADMAVDLGEDVARGIVDARLPPDVVDHRRAGRHRRLGIEYGGQHLVVDDEAPAAFLRRGFAVGDHRSDALAGKADHVVEDDGIVGVVAVELVPRRGEAARRRVLPGEHGDDPGHGERLLVADRQDAGMGVRRAQELHVQQAVDRDVEGVTRLAGHHGRPGRRRHIAAARRGRVGLVDVAHAAHGVLDGAISGAPAQIAFEGIGEVGALGLVEARSRDDHARCAKSALEALGLQKGALHRMQGAVIREAFDGRDLATFGTERREQAAVHGLAVDEHAAGAAVASVAALLHAEPSELAQEGAQALARARRRGGVGAVDEIGHDTPASSRRISSANNNVMWRRQAGAPCRSS